MTSMTKVRGFFEDIDWTKVGDIVLGFVAVVVIAIVSAINWLAITAAKAAVWFVVWTLGCVIAFLLFAHISGFKFTKLIEMLS